MSGKKGLVAPSFPQGKRTLWGSLGNCDVWLFHGSKGCKKVSLRDFSSSPPPTPRTKLGECPTSMQCRLSYKPLKFKRKREGSNMVTDQISPTSLHVTSVQKREELARRLRDANASMMGRCPCLSHVLCSLVLSPFAAALKVYTSLSCVLLVWFF
jgi:hypothetical protein